MKRTVLIFATIMALFTVTNHMAQDVKLDNAKSKLTVFGTSNIHEWDIKAEKMSGNANFEIQEEKLVGIAKLTFVVQAESLKSGKSGMDKNTYKALKTDSHKNITFTMAKVNKITPAGHDSYRVDTQGTLSIAGTAKQVNLSMVVKMLPNNGFVLTGKSTIDMTNYKVDPPTAVMGTIKTGKDVTVEFEVTYK